MSVLEIMAHSGSRTLLPGKRLVVGLHLLLQKAFMFRNRGSMFPQVKNKRPVNLLGVGTDPPNPNCMRANKMQF